VLEARPDRLLAHAGVGAREVRRIVGAEAQDGVAVIAVVVLERALPGDDPLVETIGVGERVEVAVGIEG